jgi:hypothetical protein
MEDVRMHPILRPAAKVYAAHAKASNPDGFSGITGDDLATIVPDSSIGGLFAPYYPPSLLEALPSVRWVYAHVGGLPTAEGDAVAEMQLMCIDMLMLPRRRLKDDVP